jgi:S1-C subfamily serine protease
MSRSFRLVLCLIAVFLIVPHCHRRSIHHEVWNKKVVRRALSSVVIINEFSADKEYLCAGTMIDPDGTTLTAAHCVGAKNPTFTMVTKEPSAPVYELKVIAVDKFKDLAIVKPVASAKKFKYTQVRKGDDIYVGQDIFVIGHPLGDYWVVTGGIISRLPYYWWAGCRVIESDVLINPGNSGGGMFDSDGRLIGVVSSKRIDGFYSSVSVAISLLEIHKFLERNREAILNAPQIKRQTIGD